MRETARHEVVKLLRGQIFSPAKKMDVPLVDECLKYLDEDYSAGSIPNEDIVWTRIKGRLNEKHRYFIPARRAFVISLIVVLLLALLGVAYAIFGRNVFNFYFDAGWPKSQGKVQDSAYQLLNSNLKHTSFAHTDLDVLEAVYDGHELRVVYSLWWRDATEAFPKIEEGKNGNGQNIEGIDASCFEADGIAQMCDWIEVNGESVYFSDIWTVMGDKPGQVLFYLQTNLFEYDVDIGNELTIGLPLLKVPYTRADGSQTMAHLPTAETTFTIPVTQEEGLSYKLTPMEPQTVGGYPVLAATGYFSPVSSIMGIEIIDINHEMAFKDYENEYPITRYASDWLWRGVLCDMDFNPIGITQGESWGPMWEEDGSGKCIATFSITPPDAWPRQMQLVLMDDNGEPVKDQVLVFSIEPDTK
jgi:hypothetical protein